MTVRINKQKINLREKLTEFEDKVNFDEVVRGLGENTAPLILNKDVGNVGIGTTNPTHHLNIVTSSGNSLKVENTLTTYGYGSPMVYFQQSGDTSPNNSIGLFGVGNYDDSSQLGNLFRITQSGNVGIGTTNPGAKLIIDGGNEDSSGYVFRAFASSTSTVRPSVSMGFDNGTTAYTMVLNKGSRASGYILGGFNSSGAQCFEMDDNGDLSNTNGIYGTLSSDLRLKENVVDALGKLEDLMSLEVKNYNFIGEDKKMIGFIAQDFEKVFPSLVTTSDTREYDDDGNVISGFEDAKGMKVGMEFAILTKAIQEQQSIIEDLKSRIETLESK